MDPNQQTPTDPAPAAPQEPAASTEPNVNDPAPGTFADPAQPTEPQQTTEPQSTTAPEPSEPTEPQEPGERVVPQPSEYELPEGIPDSVRIFANEHSFTQDQLNATLSQFGGYLQGMRQSEQSALRQAGETHLQNWGPDAKHKLSLAKQALHQNDPDGKLLQALNDSGWGNHPDVLNFLYNIGRSMQEGGFLKSSVAKRPGDKSAAQAMYGDNHPSEG